MQKLFLFIQVVFYKLTCNPLFILIIEKGVVIKKSGNVKSAFIKDCKEIIDVSGIKYGIIYVIKGQYGKSLLQTSGNIQADVLQKLRNVWGFNS